MGRDGSYTAAAGLEALLAYVLKPMASPCMTIGDADHLLHRQAPARRISQQL